MTPGRDRKTIQKRSETVTTELGGAGDVRTLVTLHHRRKRKVSHLHVLCLSSCHVP